jgi:hypothetical protein
LIERLTRTNYTAGGAGQRILRQRFSTISFDNPHDHQKRGVAGSNPANPRPIIPRHCILLVIESEAHDAHEHFEVEPFISREDA